MCFFFGFNRIVFLLRQIARDRRMILRNELLICRRGAIVGREMEKVEPTSETAQTI